MAEPKIENNGEEVVTPFEKMAQRSKGLPPNRVRSIIEALLFVSDKPMSTEALRNATGIEGGALGEQLVLLRSTYESGERGIVLHQVANGWQFRTAPENAEYVQHFLKVKPQRLTRAALESLAIIAYRQPVTRPEIEEIRAVDCESVLKALTDRHLIKIIGKRDEPGRPLLYGTTKEFLEFFNLKDLSGLPTLREFQELTDESREVVEKMTGEASPLASLVSQLKDATFSERHAERALEGDETLAELESAMSETEASSAAVAAALKPTEELPEDLD